jgi:hypothetical protein
MSNTERELSLYYSIRTVLTTSRKGSDEPFRGAACAIRLDVCCNFRRTRGYLNL